MAAVKLSPTFKDRTFFTDREELAHLLSKSISISFEKRHFHAIIIRFVFRSIILFRRVASIAKLAILVGSIPPTSFDRESPVFSISLDWLRFGDGLKFQLVLFTGH